MSYLEHWNRKRRSKLVFESLISLYLIAAQPLMGLGSKGVFHRQVQWSSSGGQEIIGLECSVLDSGCCYSSRLAFLTSEKRAILMTKTVDVEASEIRQEYFDVAADWNLTVIDKHKTLAEDVHNFMRFVLQDHEQAGQKSFPRVLFTSEGQRAEIEIDYKLGNWEEQMLERLLDTEILSMFRGAPDSIFEVESFFESSLAGEVDLDRQFGADLGTLLTLFDYVEKQSEGPMRSGPSRISGAKATVEWSLGKVGPLVRGRYVSEPELLELMSHFPNLENVDPFHGMLGLDALEPSR